MLRVLGDVYCRNKHGVKVPYNLLDIDNDEVDFDFEIPNSGNTEGQCNELSQERSDELFAAYKKAYGKEHEVENCKTYEEVVSLFTEKVYNLVKAHVHNNNGVDLFDDVISEEGVKIYSYIGAFAMLDRDALNRIDKGTSVVRILDTSSYNPFGVSSIDIPFKDFEKLNDFVKDILKKDKVEYKKKYGYNSRRYNELN